MARIAISYRREDTGWITGRIFDRLKEHYEGDDGAARSDSNAVFMDYDSIPIGVDFRQHLQNTLNTCDALLVIIGPHWAGDDRAGGKRITQDNDWVRVEVETALKKDIPVVPVLIDRTPMPAPDTLPEDVRGLAYRQAVVVDTQIDFNSHVERLTRQLDRILNVAPVSLPAGARSAWDARRVAGRSDRAAVDADAAGQGDRRRASGRMPLYAAVAVLLCALAAAGGWYVFADRGGIGPFYHFTSRELGVTFDFPRLVLFLDQTQEKSRKLSLALSGGERAVTVTREPRGDKDIRFDRQMESNDYSNDGYMVTLDKPDDRSRNWYVLSGLKNDEIFYVRRWYTADSVIRMDFRFPKSLAPLFDNIIGPMANKLTYVDAMPTIAP